jgi:O-antigen biosynthesis protein
MPSPPRRPSPIRVVTVEIDDPPIGLLDEIANESAYTEVWVVVMQRDQPLGIVAVTPSHAVDGPALLALLADHFRDVVTGPVDGLPLEDPPMVSVVIPTHGRRPALLTACLESISKLTYTNVEVIVVANGDEAHRSDGVPWGRFPTVRRIREPRGNAARARNIGLEAALGEIVAFTDDDVEVHPQWLHATVQRFLGLPNVDGVTGIVLPKELETPAQIWFERYYGGFNRSFVRSHYDAAYASRDDPHYPYAVGRFGTGGNMAFRVQVIRALGGFDERLGPGTPSLGGEDSALLLKLLLAGYALGVEPSAMVYHAHPRTDEELMRQVRSYGTGVSALLTATVMDDPRHLLRLLRRAPAGVRLLLQPREGVLSVGDGGYDPSVPTRLKFDEALGLLEGPVRYLYSWTRSRRRRQ